MHALVVFTSVHDPAEASRGLQEEVIPTMRNAPGFVGAYLVALDDTHGLAIEVFETEGLAKAAAPSEGASPRGVTLDAVQFGEVIAIGTG